MIFRVIVSIAIVVVFSLFVVPAASAHSTVPRVEISVERLNPGGIVDVRGLSFGMDDSVTLTLIGTGVDVSFGKITASGEGEFTYIAVLPSDLVEGTYYFRAVTSHHYVLSPALTVWGTPIMEGGGQGERDEDDGLLAPMPTYVPGVSSTPLPQTTTMDIPASREKPLALIASIVLGVGILVFFSTKFLKKR